MGVGLEEVPEVLAGLGIELFGQPSGPGCEPGDEDVGIPDVVLIARAAVHDRDREMSAAPGIEDGGEDARAVEIREAAPADGAVPTDERRCSEVSDDPVIREGQVTARAGSVSCRGRSAHGGGAVANL